MLRSAQALKGAGNVDWNIFAGPQRPCWAAERWRRSRSWSMSGRGRTGSWQTRNCYQGVSERTDGMLGKRETARAAFSGHRVKAAGWPTISTDGARGRLDMEADRLLCDDGRMLPCRPTAGKIQRDRQVESSTATGQDAGSRMRQKVVEAGRIDAGRTRTPRSGMLKSLGCDTMTGTGGSLSGRSSEPRERNGLGRSDPDRCTPLGKTSRNMYECRTSFRAQAGSAVKNAAGADPALGRMMVYPADLHAATRHKALGEKDFGFHLIFSVSG